MQKVRFSFYTKKNGDFIVYANGSNGCSVAMDASGWPSPYSAGMTDGKRNLVNDAVQALTALPVEEGCDWPNFVGRRLENRYGRFAERLTDAGKFVVRVA